MNRHFDTAERWTPSAIEARAKSLADRALTVWGDVGREGVARTDAFFGKRKPGAVRFQGQVHPIRTWKEGTVKLVELIEAARPGTLNSLVTKGELSSELSADPARFPRSKAFVGGIYINTHASVNELQRRLRKIAERAGIRESDYGFVASDDTHPS